ncbi:DUF1926 domain-containing protein [candidate division KSB1 bacterium]|nr:DUF1926 domain-containing protein [candidate division KSB1 bacterium]
MKTINLVLGLHNHQPVGNFDFVFEEAYQRAYLPFLQVLSDHPGVKAVQHYSGILFEWILDNHPEFISLLRQMVERGQVEMMTGGYYEPILVAISDNDKIGQIKKLTRFVHRHTGYAAKGIWLAERVWEPELPFPLAAAGIEYTVLDDAHFKQAGLSAADLTGYYVTESQGALLKVFPIDEQLRYTMPFQPPDVTIDYLRSLADDGKDRLAVFADDGEKFGSWPHTYEQCYEKGWLDRFFALLEENSDWIRLITFSQAIERFTPVGRVYLPTASYREMMSWALPAASIPIYESVDQWLQASPNPDAKRFFRAGFWRNFFAKYPEANQMHKRMLQARKELSELENDNNVSHPMQKRIRDHIYAAQCNCPYWHGLFGGLYLTNLRHAIYRHLLEAQIDIDRLRHTDEEMRKGWVHVEQGDMNCDGLNECMIDTDRMRLYFAPQKGASLYEWDYKARRVNLVDTLSRRREGYHHKLSEIEANAEKTRNDIHAVQRGLCSKEEGLQKFLFYDWYQRVSLVEHFMHPNTRLESFSEARYDEAGDFVEKPFELSVKKSRNNAVLIFERTGHVRVGSRVVPITLTKEIRVYAGSDELAVRYFLRNRDDRHIQVWFATELAFNLLAGDASDRYYCSRRTDIADSRLASREALVDLDHIGLVDEWMRLRIDIDLFRPAEIWRFPIETISMSEAGFERIYQASVVVPSWRVVLEPDEIWRVDLKVGLTATKP